MTNEFIIHFVYNFEMMVLIVVTRKNCTCGAVNTSSATVALTDPISLACTMSTAIVRTGTCSGEK